MYEELNAIYKPHWVRRSTKEKRIQKGKCVFDTLVTIGICGYIIATLLWMFFDAFPM